MPDETTPEQSSAPQAGPDQADQKTPASDDATDLATRLAAAEAQAVANWERYLRATAEQDNLRKRAEREVEAAKRFALERFAGDILRVRDSLELGLKAATEAAADAKQIEGMELTLRMLIDSMGRHGIEAIDPTGQPFNPAEHEAMAAVPSADAAPNTVLEVMQKGYRLNERVLRPAMVVVTQAPPADASEPSPPAA